MKKTALLPALLSIAMFVSFRSTAQQLPIPTQEQHSVAVKGNASQSLRPDEIYVAAVLKEFSKDRKVITLAELESGFTNFVEKSIGLPKTSITVDAPNPGDQLKSDDTPTKVLQIKCTDPEQAAKLFAAMDSLGVDRMNIRHLTNSKLDDYKDQLKTQAVKNAHEKAVLLLSAVACKPGDLLTLTEVTESSWEQGSTNYSYGSYSYGKKSAYGGRSVQLNSSISSDDNSEIRDMINRIRNYSISISFDVAATFAIVKL